MKTKLFYLALALLTLHSPLSTAHAQGTAFTYQGVLKNGNLPANGTYDLTFTLYDAGAIGNLIAGPVTNAATVVSNGLFTTTIDFGPGIFTGANYWLEIGVETNGAGGVFSVLSARQALTPTPYAIYSSTAGSAVSATTAGTANGVSAGSVTGAGIAPGQVVTSLNSLADAVTLSAGTNVTITPSGNTLTISSAGAGGNGIWSVNANNTYYSAGKVGIGTSTPKGALHVASGGVAVTGASSPYTGAGQGAFLEYNGTYGGILFAYDYGANSPLNLLLNSPGGNVGIGTLTPAAKLTVHDSGSVSHRIETSGGVNAWARVEFANGNGQWDVGTSRGYNSDSLYFHHETAATDALALQPNGNATFGGNVTLSGSAAVSHRLQTSGGVNTWTRMEFANANGQWNVGTSLGYNGDQFYFNRQGVSANALALQPNGDAAFSGNLGIGTTSPQYTLDVNGTTRTHSIIITGGADLAEPFKMGSRAIEKGSVVVIDEEHPGELKLSRSAYDTRVAGIVSGGNGINPGIALQQEGALEGGQNVALTGRVYVLADATHGPIKPGDLLTTSDIPGHAMKVTDQARASGAILGKAMTGLNEGTGMVLVLVTLQ